MDMYDIGIDIVDIKDFEEKIKDKSFLMSVFTESELASFSTVESLSGVFALKEACFKALGEKIGWKDVWIERNKDGSSAIKTNINRYVFKSSVSHSASVTVAVVILIKNHNYG